MKSLIIGSRGSPLALAQVDIVRGLLQKESPSRPIEAKIIKTSGDNFTNLSLTTGGGKGLFTKEIEDQLLGGEIDIAIHSMKDLPTVLPDGLIIGAVPSREDAHDVFISKNVSSIEKLPNRARVATSSVRRRAQLLALRPDLQIEEIRGNVETRLRKLAESDVLDAIILAGAGLRRLGLWNQLGDLRLHEIDFDVMIPAVGQGALACEMRATDGETRDVLASINDMDAATCTTAERTFLRALGGGCQVPYAAHATVEGNSMRMIAGVFDGRRISRATVIGSKEQPEELGEEAAKQCQA